MSRDYDAESINLVGSDRVENEWFQKEADVILLDLNLPNNFAVEIVRYVRQTQPNAKVIILVPDDHRGLLECVASGVQGCVLERSSLQDLDLAIDKSLRGETVCSSEFAATMFSELYRFSNSPSWQVPAAISRTRLTAREHEVIELLAKRNSNKQIAKELCVSIYTVKNHIHNILEKLDVESRVEAVELALQENWLSHR